MVENIERGVNNRGIVDEYLSGLAFRSTEGPVSFASKFGNDLAETYAQVLSEILDSGSLVLRDRNDDAIQHLREIGLRRDLPPVLVSRLYPDSRGAIHLRGNRQQEVIGTQAPRVLHEDGNIQQDPGFYTDGVAFPRRAVLWPFRQN